MYAWNNSGAAFCEEELGHAGPTVQEQEHRVPGVPTHDEHALPHAVDLDERLLGQAAGHGSCVPIDDARRLPTAPHQEEDHHGKGDDERSADEGRHESHHLSETRRHHEAAQGSSMAVVCTLDRGHGRFSETIYHRRAAPRCCSGRERLLRNCFHPPGMARIEPLHHHAAHLPIGFRGALPDRLDAMRGAPPTSRRAGGTHGWP